MKKYIVEQKLAPLANQYRVYETKDDGTKADLVAFAHQKRLTMKEQVQVFADETKQQQAFTIKAEKVLDVHGKFFVRDTAGKTVGVFRKSFKSSLLRSTYELMDGEDTVICIVQERSKPVAILRRIWGLLPVIGELPFVFKYHFDFVDQSSKQVIGRYNKTKLFLDHYELIIDDDSLIKKVGWQTLAAQAIMLDVMQDR